MNVLVTGATGFLGGYLVKSLLKAGNQVTILKRSTSNVWRIEEHINQVTSYDVDLQSLEKVFEEKSFDCIIHTACNYGRNGDSLCKVVDDNLNYGLKILDLALLNDVKWFINADTLMPKDLSNYTFAKSQFVEWLRRSKDNIGVVNLKIEHMYGPKDDKNKFLYWLLFKLMKNVESVDFTKGDQQRDFVHVSDVVSAFNTVINRVSLLKRDFYQYEVGYGAQATLKEYIELIKKEFDVSFFKSRTKLNFGALPYRRGELMNVKADIQSLLDLGWQPEYPLDVGMSKTIEDIFKNKEIV
jgi:CDP-paratose synthetase